MCKLLMLLALVATCKPPVEPPVIAYATTNYSQAVSTSMEACGKFLVKHKVEQTEKNWFICVHALGGTL